MNRHAELMAHLRRVDDVAERHGKSSASFVVCLQSVVAGRLDRSC